MLWFYERDDRTLRVEQRYDNATREFLVTLHYPDGRTEIESFTTLAAFREWLLGLDRRLDAEHWTRQGPPVFLPDGWPDEPLA